MFALIRPVTTSTDGRWVATTRWMPTARAICAIRQIASSTSRGATIIRSASSSITTTMYGHALELVAPARAGIRSVPSAEPGVVRLDVAHADRRRASRSAAPSRGRPTASASAARFGCTMTGASRCGRSAKCDSSTRLGSISTSFTSSGVVRIRIDVTNVLIRLDFPAPVAPAISTCGISARFTMNARPWTSLPRPDVQRLRDLLRRLRARGRRPASRSRGPCSAPRPRSPTCPGIGAMIRTSGVASA